MSASNIEDYTLSWGCHVVPVDCFQYRTTLPGCHGFDASVTAFHNAIPSWYVNTPEPQMHTPAPRKFLKLPSSEHGATNWLNALNSSVVYAVMRACLICSASALCSLLSLLYTARALPHSRNGRMHSTLSMAQSSQTNSTFSIHSTIGISVIVPLNSGISRTSKALPSIICMLK